MEEEHRWTLEHIPGDDQVDATATADVLAADIEPKQASALIKVLSAIWPLTDLNHVKRVRRRHRAEGAVDLSIILCVREDESDEIPIGIMELVQKHGLTVFSAKVPRYAASSREEWTAQCELWPTSFHPNCVRPTKLEFDEHEEKVVSNFMLKAMQLANSAVKHGRLPNGAVVVDPSLGQVIATGYDESSPPSCTDCSSCSGSWHPLRHAAMVAIENAAERDRRLFPDEKQEPEKQESDESAKKRPRLAQVELGDGTKQHSIELPRPYLCTGFDIYLVREPCAMCAMAMVHQRFRRVIYSIKNPENGALGGKFFLHRRRSLNHHYTVIQARPSEDKMKQL